MDRKFTNPNLKRPLADGHLVKRPGLSFATKLTESDDNHCKGSCTFPPMYVKPSGKEADYGVVNVTGTWGKGIVDKLNDLGCKYEEGKIFVPVNKYEEFAKIMKVDDSRLVQGKLKRPGN